MTPLQTAATRLGAAIEMLTELRPYVREAAEQKYAAAMTELAGASESIGAASQEPTPAAPPSLAELAGTAGTIRAAAQFAADELGKLIEASKAAAAAPVVPTFGQVRP